MKNKRILVFTLLMSALLVFSAMPAFSADEEVTFAEEFFTAETDTAIETKTAVDAKTKADDTSNMETADVSSATTEEAVKSALQALDTTKVKENGFVPTGTINVSITVFISALQSELGDNLTILNFSQVKFNDDFNGKLPLDTLSNITSFSFVSGDKVSEAAAKVTEITLPDQIEEFNGRGTSIKTLKLTTALKVLNLTGVTTLKELTNFDSITTLKKLKLDGATELGGAYDFAKNTDLTDLGLNGTKVTKVSLKNNSKAVNLALASLGEADEGAITLPDEAPNLENLDISGNKFAFVNSVNTRFAKLTDAKFIRTNQIVDRSDVTVITGLNFAISKLFATYLAEDDSTPDLTKVTSVTALDASGNTLATETPDGDGEVNFDVDATKIASLSYVYNTGTGDLTVAASGVTGEEDSGNPTVGGSGGGCSAGFGALALAAVAAFLLKKSR